MITRALKWTASTTLHVFELMWALVCVVLFLAFLLAGLHMEGIISVEPLIVVMNHIIDGALRELASHM